MKISRRELLLLSRYKHATNMREQVKKYNL